MAFQDGQLILNGKYRVIRLVGEGAMARVWLAEELTFGGRQVAIKEPRSDLLPQDTIDVKRRFQQEIRLAAQMMERGVPHIVPAWTVELYDDSSLLVMRFMAGGSLEELLREHTEGLPIRRAVEMTKAIVLALEGFHGLVGGPVHRDVKPSNVLLDGNGGAHLADFGLAQLPGTSGRSALMGGGHPCTPLYAAPEQLRSPEPLLPAADLYATGCMLFEMLTGKTYKRCKPGTSARSFRAEMSSRLDEALSKALTEDPWDRVSSGAELLELLDQTEGPAESYQTTKHQLERVDNGATGAKCTACGTWSTGRYCRGCGSQLYSYCYGCGLKVRSGDKHCPGCGAQLSGSTTGKRVVPKAGQATVSPPRVTPVYAAPSPQEHPGVVNRWIGEASERLSDSIAQRREEREARKQAKEVAKSILKISRDESSMAVVQETYNQLIDSELKRGDEGDALDAAKEGAAIMLKARNDPVTRQMAASLYHRLVDRHVGAGHRRLALGVARDGSRSILKSGRDEESFSLVVGLYAGIVNLDIKRGHRRDALKVAAETRDLILKGSADGASSPALQELYTRLASTLIQRGDRRRAKAAAKELLKLTEENVK